MYSLGLKYPLPFAFNYAKLFEEFNLCDIRIIFSDIKERFAVSYSVKYIDISEVLPGYWVEFAV